MKVPMLLPKILRTKSSDDDAGYRRLLSDEAKIGGQLFGPVPAGHRREFFCLDEHTWVWHEEWIDSMGLTQSVTTRYDVHPGGILKSQGSSPYSRITYDEAVNLYKAVDMYEKHVGRYYDYRLQAA